ncbi:MAG: molybdenum cofactor biosynthesis protein MoaE, partial [Ilumatobacteraceae bacterium]
MQAPDTGDEWLSLTDAALPIGDAYDWVVRDDCGAVVLFSGTTRDHAEGRDGVTSLTYEAYAEEIDLLRGAEAEAKLMGRSSAQAIAMAKRLFLQRFGSDVL